MQILQLTAVTDAAKGVLSSTSVSRLLDLMESSEIVRFRVYELTVRVGTLVSHSSSYIRKTLKREQYTQKRATAI